MIISELEGLIVGRRESVEVGLRLVIAFDDDGAINGSINSGEHGNPM